MKLINFKPIEMPLDGVESIVVMGQVGDVSLMPSRGATATIKVSQSYPEGLPAKWSTRVDEWNFMVQRQGARLVLQVQPPGDREVWADWVKSDSAPRFDLEIFAPSMPAEISLWRGQVRSEKWGSGLRIALQKGSVRISGGEGDLGVTGGEIDLSVEGRKGRVIGEVYGGSVNLKRVEGRISIENFSGDAKLTSCSGAMDLRTFKGQIKVEGGQGNVDFAIAGGQIKLVNFEGGLRGVADQGSVTGSLLGATDVRVTTAEGQVQLDLPGSGAQLSLSSKEGAVSSASYLRSELVGGRRVLRGRLRGNVDGLVVVKTEAGPIRVR